MSRNTEFAELAGQTLVEIVQDEETLTFTTSAGRVYRQLHYQDCCEVVRIEEIVGDLADLLNVPILLAEESSSELKQSGSDTGTWTFYKLTTIQGGVTIRWLGTSNGYYSESVNFIQVS